MNKETTPATPRPGHTVSPQAAAPGGGPAPVTYHDSCHMCRLAGLRGEPRRALVRAGISILEMEESDRCCGFGGTFSVKLPEVAEAMTREKLRRAAATGAQTLVTADPGCLMQMRRFAGEYGLAVEHFAAVLDATGQDQKTGLSPGAGGPERRPAPSNPGNPWPGSPEDAGRSASQGPAGEAQP